MKKNIRFKIVPAIIILLLKSEGLFGEHALKKITSDEEATITVTELTVPPLAAFTEEMSFDTILVRGINLTSEITLNVSGKNADCFKVSPNLLAPTAGIINDMKVTIKYHSAIESSDTAILTLSTNGIEPITYRLTGKSFTLNGKGTSDKAFTVADVKKLNNEFAPANQYWVQGYITGIPLAGNLTGNLTAVNTEVPFLDKTAIVLSDTNTETDPSKMIAIELLSGKIQDALNLKDNPDNIQKTVKVLGFLEPYFSTTPGLKGVSEYRLFNASLPLEEIKPFLIYTLDGRLHIETPENSKITIFDMIGKKVYEGALNSGHSIIELLCSGVMLVKTKNNISKVVL